MNQFTLPPPDHSNAPAYLGFLSEEVRELKEMVSKLTAAKPADEIIDRQELMRRLGVTDSTVMRYEKIKKIPVIRLGGTIRYNWGKVLDALENKKRG